MSASGDNRGSYEIVLCPTGADPLSVLFEPGAGEFEIDSGDHFRMVVSGPEGERVEFAHGPGYVSVWPSPALSVVVYDSAGAAVPLLGY
ncbi:hypothetical protein SAMN05660733_08065 [Lentzea albidocapillata]|uniref:Uncharacterized protein n=1 Tax=Lentzea albidocapillata TaxID=40571 RepID=A0A1W2FUE3_9PSEU|nr:hypothetical protein SAMN05660733_08065 [Lentzea albidocapillata]